jgi:hypothetical protein
LLHENGRSQLHGVKKNLGDSGWKADAAMGGGIRRNVTLMHGVTAAKEHREGHARAIVMRAFGAGILGGINIGFHDVPEVVHIIAEPGRDMVFVFPNHPVLARRRGKPGLAGGNGGFAHLGLSFKEVGALLVDVHDNFRGARDPVAIPSVRWRGGSGRCRRRCVRRFELRAAGE